MDKNQVMARVTNIWNSHIPFNQLLGFTITKMAPQESEIQFPWNHDLMGNPVQQILHGGVIASVLDMAGGVVAAANIIDNLPDLSDAVVNEKLSRMSTIDLRTDYLRPGKGELFIATAKIIRKGSKVAVARMELHNQKNTHIAFGTGTYIVG